MSQAALTAKYRPQRFEDVAGQETLKGILSRAALEDRIAPAYLFSGTRGVGKTTVARILAKAVNCLEAPVAEPCNQCRHCRQITQGVAVDVIEIDGASNRGIDDARRIREDIGYAPMECKYKVFIIDEAHMLTKEASNALLKTLEEPPGNATFILATTEPHKILPTIISRCQHYSFKRLTMPGLVAHLEKVLQQEDAAYDPKAVQLIAQRASGSVRDSMSLLGQALALGKERLEVEDVRAILGLAGNEIFFNVLAAVHKQDPLAVNELLRQLLDQGLDLGFFLRELAQTWRNLFLLRQAGDKALPMLELTEEEAGQWVEWSQTFSLAHIHAAWQLTLEGQRRVLTSLEPALALELLLLNLAFLPSLVSLEQVGAVAPAPPQAAQQTPGPTSGQTPGQTPGQTSGQTSGLPPTQAETQAPAQPTGQPTGQPAGQPGPPPQQGRPPGQTAPQPPLQRQEAQAGREPRPAATQPEDAQGQAQDQPQEDPEPPAAAAPPTAQAQSRGPQEPEPEATGAGTPAATGLPRTWDHFLEFAAQRAEVDGKEIGHLRQIEGHFDPQENLLGLTCLSAMQRRMVTENDYGKWLTTLVREFFGQNVTIQASEPDNSLENRNNAKELLAQNPLVQTLQQEFGARIVTWGTRKQQS